MSIIGSYNGASIIAFPTHPAPKQIELGMSDSVAINRSPFTGSTQTLTWPGADWWDASIALPKLLPTDAAVWSSFLAELRGMQNVFLLGDPTYKGPKGSVLGSPVVNGINNAMSTTLNTRGWQPNAFGLLRPGDYLQLGTILTITNVRLHRVLDLVDSDANGDASITIWPSIREATVDGQAISFNNPQGTFRLATNRRSVLTDETHLSGVSLKAIEAR